MFGNKDKNSKKVMQGSPKEKRAQSEDSVVQCSVERGSGIHLKKGQTETRGHYWRKENRMQTSSPAQTSLYSYSNPQNTSLYCEEAADGHLIS